MLRSLQCCDSQPHVIPQLQSSFVPSDSIHPGKGQAVGKPCTCGVFISILFGPVYLLRSRG
uniref:Uncharacterized protein n=1 Tax=Arundo donax TaxID=35708 RepID=A0A0A9HF78_ARUDO